METMIRIAALCLISGAAASMLKNASPEFTLLLTVASVLAGGALLLSAAQDLTALGGELVALTGLAPEVFGPLWKVTAIALISHVGAAVCSDAGQSALARLMEAAGAVCALVCALPLVEATIDLIKIWL